MKIDGIRRRQLPAGALSKTVALTPDNTMISTRMPNTVASSRTPVVSTEIDVVLNISSKQCSQRNDVAPQQPDRFGQEVSRRLSDCCSSVSTTSSVGSPTAMITDQ